MRALLAKLKEPWLFVWYIEEFAKKHVRKNEGQLYLIIMLNPTLSEELIKDKVNKYSMFLYCCFHNTIL